MLPHQYIELWANDALRCFTIPDAAGHSSHLIDATTRLRPHSTIEANPSNAAIIHPGRKVRLRSSARCHENLGGPVSSHLHQPLPPVLTPGTRLPAAASTERQVASVAALALMVASPAYAAAPANDTFGGSTTIGPVPYSTTQDTSEATTDAVDAEANADCGAPATDASVWYSVTPATDTAFIVDVGRSSYSAGVLVVTGEPGSLSIVTCGPGTVGFPAAAGITYHLLIIDDQFDGGGNGGTLVLNVDEAPPPPKIDLTVNPTAKYDARTGSATVSGTIICSGQVEFTFIYAELTQRIGPGVVVGSGFTESIRCDGTVQQWSVEVVPFLGQKFIGGKAASFTFAIACGPFFCSDDFEQRTVLISRR